MVLDLSYLKKYSKAVEKACLKTGVLEKDSLYLDFNKKEILFNNDSFIGKVDFSFTLEAENEHYENVFLNTKKLFSVLNYADFDVKLTFRKEEGGIEDYVPVLSFGEETFIIEHIYEGNFPDIEFVRGNEEIITVDGFLKACLEEAVTFVEENPLEFNAVILHDDNVSCVSSFRYYNQKLDNLRFNSQINIHRDLVKVITSFAEDVELQFNDVATVLVSEGIFITFGNNIVHTSVPTDEELSQIMKFDNKVTVNKEDFAKIIKFLDPFYDAVLKTKVIKIKIKDNNTMVVSNLSDFDEVHRYSEIEVNGDLTGFESEYDSVTIKSLLNYISTESLDLYLDDEVFGATFCESDSLNKKMVVIQFSD
jgi:hypothetical protein